MASIATRIVIALVTCWIVFYLVVYFVLLGPGGAEDDPVSIPSQNIAALSGNAIAGVSGGGGTVAGVPFHIDSFVSSSCQSRHFESNVKGWSATVIIVARNEKKESLLATVSSVKTYSSPFLKNVVVVDDMSVYPVSGYPEWAQYSNVHIERTPRRVGVATAKAFGANYALASDKPAELNQHLLVFLDSHSIVSENWLVPLIATVQTHPNAVVYPAIDVLDAAAGKVMRSGNVVGGFDWSLKFQWEDVSSREIATSRLGFDSSTTIGPDTACSSPAAPGIFALSGKYYQDLGGFDTNLKSWGMESVELSLRAWMCGGMVIRQPCSRVAHQYENMHGDAYAGGGDVREGDVDRNALLVAEHWMDDKHKHIVFMKRFLHRIEYKVDVSLDARSPAIMYGKNLLTSKECMPFEWYLDEIYPGLRTDALSVEAEYRHHLTSKYEQDILTPLMKQYRAESTFDIDSSVVELLQRRAETPEEQALRRSHAKLEPVQPARKKVVLDMELLPVVDEHDRHANGIRETMICEDEPASAHRDADCPTRKARGECETNRAYMIFGCPRTCGLCSSDGLMCTNFFDRKCPEWKQDDQCNEDPRAMRKACKPSCGWCTPDPNAGHFSALKQAEKPVVNNHPDIPTAPKDIQYTAQRKYAAGELPDPSPPKGACSIDNLPNGLLLAHVNLSPEKPAGPRVFCAVYTMEKNHETNVKATVSTWGKRCHGFLAFSTVDDHSIPAVKIEHEGEESYDNMWQKSRSIWKYIAKNFLSEFDYFLIGGDDMFYIVENLIEYLGSPEIEGLRSQGKGMYIGRRFFPPKQEVFNSGGAGYILDKVSLGVLLDNLDSPKCYPHQKGFWEDVNIANCLRKSANIIPLDSRDSLKRERFHPFTPGQHLEYRKPPGDGDWYPKYNPELTFGYDCCSDKSISFHYCAAPIMTSLHSYLYHCAKKTVK